MLQQSRHSRAAVPPLLLATMASTSNSPASNFASAKVRLLSESNFKLAHIFVSNCVNWRVVGADSQSQPKSIADFCDGSSIALNRLGDIPSWKVDMKRMVSEGHHNRKTNHYCSWFSAWQWNIKRTIYIQY